MKQCWPDLYAKTGVFSYNRVGSILDLISNFFHEVIDLSAIEGLKEFYGMMRDLYNNTHDEELPEDYDFDLDPYEIVDQMEKDSFMDCIDYHKYLINFIEDPEYPGEYIEDPNAEYSCVITEECGFVTKSRYLCKAPPGSPCIPNQCCLDDKRSPRTDWAFTLPPDVWDEDLPEGMEIIEISNRNIFNLSGILNLR